MTVDQGYFRQLPAKHLSAGALFFDEDGGLLLVKPTYKEGWEIPGGIVEDDESPTQACLREVREELGLTVTLRRLLVVDYLRRKRAPSDSLHFVFYGGVLEPDQIAAIELPADELSEYRFVVPEEAPSMAHGQLGPRILACLVAIAERRTLMLHEGVEA